MGNNDIPSSRSTLLSCGARAPRSRRTPVAKHMSTARSMIHSCPCVQTRSWARRRCCRSHIATGARLPRVNKARFNWNSHSLLREYGAALDRSSIAPSSFGLWRPRVLSAPRHPRTTCESNRDATTGEIPKSRSSKEFLCPAKSSSFGCTTDQIRSVWPSARPSASHHDSRSPAPIQ
jgi:hypothetical protein